MVLRGQTLGKYRLLEPLGSGGFGTVYLAEDTWIDKRVAIKIPHRQNLDFGELLREPRLLASLNHPNIVTVITAEKQDNVFFIVMEYVPGETLETIIGARGALDLPVALDYTCQIVNAVEHAHRQGVLHRDLRPANVFVTERGLLKVGDFGTSRFLEIAAHGTTVIGSPPYMAPEQFEGRAVFASDLYSLGVSMYQMLTGVLPYDMPAPSDLDRLKTGELITSPRLRNPAIPAVIDQIVLKALSADVGARYQRAEDLLADLLAARRELVRRPGADAPLAPTPAGRIGAAVAGASGFGAAAGERARPLDGGANGGGHGGRSVDVSTPVEADAGDHGAAGPPRSIERPGHRPGAAGRMRTREVGASRFCWHCRKPLPARGASCPFCGERQ